jgi:hypothetical protein
VVPEADKLEPTATTIVAPELTAMRSMPTATDAEKLARRAKLRPSPLDYDAGSVRLVPDGYGDLLHLLPGMEPVANGNLTDIFTITWSTGRLLVMTSGLEIIITERQWPRFNW